MARVWSFTRIHLSFTNNINYGDSSDPPPAERIDLCSRCTAICPQSTNVVRLWVTKTYLSDCSAILPPLIINLKYITLVTLGLNLQAEIDHGPGVVCTRIHLSFTNNINYGCTSLPSPADGIDPCSRCTTIRHQSANVIVRRVTKTYLSNCSVILPPL